MSKQNTYQDTSVGELTTLLEQQRQKLAELRVELRLQKTNAHSGVRQTRRDVARILTAMQARRAPQDNTSSEVKDV